jgi:hypothetical protein
MTRGIWRAESGIFLGLWLLILFVGRDGFLRDPGVFWHTVLGREILSTGRIPTHDAYSCTRAGRAFLASQWLPECIMALLYDLGGLDALLLALATILAGLYTYVAHRLIRAGLHWAVAVVVVWLTILASFYHFHPRPHLVTIALLGWTYAQLIDFDAGRISLRRLGWLLPLFVLWTNMHGGVVGGITTVGLAALGWSAAWLLQLPSPVGSWRQLLALACLVVACGLTTLVNPATTQLPRLIFQLTGSPVLRQFIVEHQPLHPLSAGDRGVTLLAVIYLATLTEVLLAHRCCPRISWLLPLVWLLLAIRGIRHGPLFAVMAALSLGELLPRTRWAAWLARRGTGLFVPPPQNAPSSRGRAWLLVPLAAVLLALGLQAAAIRVPLVGHDWARLEPSWWPVDLLPQLWDQVKDRRPGEVCIFNEMLYGGFLILYVPQARVFIDDRCDLYGDEMLRDFFTARGDDPAQPGGDPAQVRRWVDEYHIDLALIHEPAKKDAARKTAFNRYFATAPDWVRIGETRQIETTGGAVLYRRTRSLTGTR